MYFLLKNSKFFIVNCDNTFAKLLESLYTKIKSQLTFYYH